MKMFFSLVVTVRSSVDCFILGKMLQLELLPDVDCSALKSVQLEFHAVGADIFHCFC